MAPRALATPGITVADPAGPRVVTSEQVERLASRLYSKRLEEMSPRAARVLALELLVPPLWREGAAREQGVSLTDAELAAGHARYMRDAFPKPSDLRAFRQRTGFSVDDLKGFSRDILFMSALEQRLLAPVSASVTDAAIDAYIAEHGPMMTPERRDFRYINVTSRAGAERARAALERGATWSQVARRYAAGRESHRLDDVVEDAFGLALDRAAFRAPEGRPVGPLKGRSAYFVLEVTRIHPPKPLPAAQHRRIVRSQLLEEAEERIVTPWAAAAMATWTARTVCAPDYDWYARCANWDGTKLDGVGPMVWIE